MTVSRSSRPETPRALAQATASSAIARTFGERPSAPLAKALLAGVATAGTATAAGADTAATAGTGCATAAGAGRAAGRVAGTASVAMDGVVAILGASAARVRGLAAIRVTRRASRTAGVRDRLSIVRAWPPESVASVRRLYILSAQEGQRFREYNPLEGARIPPKGSNFYTAFDQIRPARKAAGRSRSPCPRTALDGDGRLPEGGHGTARVVEHARVVARRGRAHGQAVVELVRVRPVVEARAAARAGIGHDRAPLRAAVVLVAMAIGVRRGGWVVRGIVPGGLQMADLMREGVVAGDAVPVGVGERRARRGADARRETAGRAVVDHQEPDVRRDRVARRVDRVHEAVAGPAITAQIGAEAAALRVGDLRLVGEHEVDEDADVARRRGGGRGVVDHDADDRIADGLVGRLLLHRDIGQPGILFRMIGRHGRVVHHDDGMAAGLERADLVPLAVEVHVAGDRLPILHQHHGVDGIELERIRREGDVQQPGVLDDAVPDRRARVHQVGIDTVRPQIEPSFQIEVQGRRLHVDQIGMGLHEFQGCGGGVVGQRVVGRVQRQGLPVGSGGLEAGKECITCMSRGGEKTEHSRHSKGTDPTLTHHDLLTDKKEDTSSMALAERLLLLQGSLAKVCACRREKRAARGDVILAAMSRATPVLALTALLGLLLACEAWGQAPPVIAAAGDIACDPGDASYNGGNGTASACRMKATSDLLLGLGLTAVLPLGDNQYEDGAATKYQASYDPTWGRLKALTRPVPGNHEYATPAAAAYFSYFGAAAGDPAKGYYSYDLGGWHLIALNSNCPGGCGAGSLQEQWLAADLAAHPGTCTLAYWHHPRFSSGPHGNDATSDAFWQDLYAAGADVILNGHDHVYERFAPQSPAAAADPAQGIRQFTVGTGGKNLTGFSVIRANSEVRNASAFGILEMTLYPIGYSWRFLSASGGTVLDQGATLCHSTLPWPGTELYTVPPCRVVDTRNPAGVLGGPALAGAGTRSFPIAGTCGIPADAVAVAANVTILGPTISGNLEIHPTGGLPTSTSTINFTAGQIRANNSLLTLGVGGEISVTANLSAAGTVQFVLDVTGYFR